MSEILTMGEPMVVYIAEKPGNFSEVSGYTRGIAGAELNFSIGVTRLGHPAAYFTRLGEEPYGDYIESFIRQEGIDGSRIIRDPDHLTGSYLKTKVLTGDPAVYYFRKNSAASHICPGDIRSLDFHGVRHVHITGITAALSDECRQACLELIRRARGEGIPVSFDPNIREQLWESRDMMKEVLNQLAFASDLVLPGIGEGKLLTGRNTPEEIADFYLEGGAKAAAVKTGADGAYYKAAAGFGEEPEQKSGYVAGYIPDRIVDTVGAGDAFAAGIVTGLLEGLSLAEAVDRGNAMGAMILSSEGDNEGLPDRQALEEYQKRAERKKQK